MGDAALPSTAPSPPPTRASLFSAALSAPVINLTTLKALASDGIPEEDLSVRAQIWKLLLGFLPLQRAEWQPHVAKKEAEYSRFCRELIIDPKTLGRPPTELLEAATAALKPLTSNGGIGSSPLHRTTVAHDDHPLSTSDSSRWHAFFADAEIREQIERDVDRTHPDLNFFSGKTEAAATHRAAMRRALFIFAKLNPGLRYVQGMNELFAVLYHTFAVGGGGSGGNRKNTPFSEINDGKEPISIECAAFFCFCDLMGEFRDHFCQQLDNSEVGIRATMSRLSTSLKGFDPEVWTHVEKSNGVIPQFYAFRWITTLLTHEFTFPDVVRLWDALLVDSGCRTDCLLRLCLAMVLLVREELLSGDFASNMKVLQNYPPMDVAAVLRKAEELRQYKTVIVLDD